MAERENPGTVADPWKGRHTIASTRPGGDIDHDRQVTQGSAYFQQGVTDSPCCAADRALAHAMRGSLPRV